MLCSLSASASHVAAMGGDTVLYNFEIVFPKNVFNVYCMFFRNFFNNFMEGKRPSDAFTIFSQFFCLFFSRLLTYTNRNILMDAKQWVGALILLRLFEPFVFDNPRTS